MQKVKLGNNIRHARKKMGLSIKQLANMAGVSYATIHRVETDKVSPSVALLSEIAHHLGQPIDSFLVKMEGKFKIMKAGKATEVKSGKQKLQLLAPRGFIDKDISVSLTQSQIGEFVSTHRHNGFELTYIIKGKSIISYGSEKYEAFEGDLIYFDAGVPHSVTALDPIQALSIYFRQAKSD
jgi:transcriptional regulator with XRE-family HTH domain